MFHNTPAVPSNSSGVYPPAQQQQQQGVLSHNNSSLNAQQQLRSTNNQQQQQGGQQMVSKTMQVASSNSNSYHPSSNNNNNNAQNSNNNNPEGKERLSGGKRDAETAAATDVVNQVPPTMNNNNNNLVGASSSSSINTQVASAATGGSSSAGQQPPVKKQKITYALPSQNMEEGHFYVVLGEDIDVSTGRFKILSLLGEGTFGKVVESWDRKRKEYCAVKIVRNIPKYTRDAEYEIRFMERIRQADPNDNFALMKILRHFRNDPQHVCIVMPKFGPCLLDHLQKHGPFPHRHLAEIIFHSAVALDYMHSELRLMHTDLKPENMLLESGKVVPDGITGRSVPQLPCRVRICDLGGCCDENHSRSAIVSTRHYRSPEVILGLGWMFSTDIWSMGCIIYELATGRLLYDTHENLEHLHIMEKTLGRLPTEWAPRVRDDCRNLFNANGTIRPLTESKSLSRVSRARPVRESIQDDLLRDLILNSLTYDRSKRLSARALSSHPYILKYFPESLAAANHPKNRSNLHPVPSL